MVARCPVWIVLGLGLLSASLAPGCRSFTFENDPNGSGGGGQGGAGNAGNAGMITNAGGSNGDAGVTGEAGAEGETGGAGAGSGGEVGSLAGRPAGSGGASGPEFSGREVVNGPLDGKALRSGNAQWTHIVPFAHGGTPHFVAYNDVTGSVTFRQTDPSSTTVWSGNWGPGLTAFSRLAPKGQERLVLYRKATGVRQVVGIVDEQSSDDDLNGASVLLETTIGTGFVHHASHIARDGIVDLYWHHGDGNLLVDRLNSEATGVASSFTGALGDHYTTLGAIGDRLLAFHGTNFDVFDVDELTELDQTTPIYATGLGDVNHLVAFELEEVPLLFVYSMLGNFRLLELVWTEDSVHFQEVAGGNSVITNATSVTGLSLPDHQLIFLHANNPEDPQLQVMSFALAPREP